MFNKRVILVLGLLMLGGCQYPLRQQVDNMVCKDATLDAGWQAPKPATKRPATDSNPRTNPTGLLDEKEVDGNPDLLLMNFQDKDGGKKPNLYEVLEKKVAPGSDVPGSEQPAMVLPKKGTESYLASLDAAAKIYFKDLPPLSAEFKPARGPNGQPLTLTDLQKIARQNSPLLRAAGANVESARGAAVQAGAYPNPTVNLGGNTQGPGGGPVYGPNVSQQIITAGKLSLAQAAAIQDVKMSEWAFRRAETDLSWNVRSGYFAVLVAQESIRANRALVSLTDEVYRVMVKQFRNGENAGYEPAQMGVFAEVTRTSLIQSRNAYTLAWKNLASALGLPGMPPTELAGKIGEVKMPNYHHDDVLPFVLKNHTDAKTAEENIQKARYNLRLAEVNPIPDLNTQFGGWYDNTQGNGPYRMAGMFNIGITIPVWNQNRGAIRQQQGVLLAMNEEPHRVRAALTASLADAFRRYDENRDLLKMYRLSILPKQVQAFRGALKRYNVVVGEVAYWDVINSEQNLITMIGNYLPILGNMWQAVADVANLMQTDDLFQMSSDMPPVPSLDLEKMIQCCHPCSDMQAPALKTFDAHWPLGGKDINPPEPKKLRPMGAQLLPPEPHDDAPAVLHVMPPVTPLHDAGARPTALTQSPPVFGTPIPEGDTVGQDQGNVADLPAAVPTMQLPTLPPPGTK